MPFLDPDAKRLHNDRAPDEPEEPLVEETLSEVCEEVEAKGDPRLTDHVHFEHCAHETFSEEFCVPSKGHTKPRSAKGAKHEGGIKRDDLDYFCHAILVQEERKGYWQIDPEEWADEEALVIFEFESLAFAIQCDEKRLVRISAKDVAAMLGPCLDLDSDKVAVKKVTSTWISHTDSEKATFRWEIRGPQKIEAELSTRNLLQQRAQSFFKTGTFGNGKEKESQARS